MFGNSKKLFVIVLLLFIGQFTTPIIIHATCTMPTCEVEMSDSNMVCCSSNLDCGSVFTPVTTAPIAKFELQVKLIVEFNASKGDYFSNNLNLLPELSRNKIPYFEAHLGYSSPLLI
jgi:hypothetical protein